MMAVNQMGRRKTSKEVNVPAQGVLWGQVEVPETASAVGLVGHEQKFEFSSRLLGSHWREVKTKTKTSSFGVEDRLIRSKDHV